MVLVTIDSGAEASHRNHVKQSPADSTEHTLDHNGNQSLHLKHQHGNVHARVDWSILNEAKKLYVVTPLIESLQISKRVGYNVFIKMENLQPCGSFKLRGLSYHCLKVGDRFGLYYVQPCKM